MSDNKIPFFDGHNDFLLRLMMTDETRGPFWRGPRETGHLDLARMREGMGHWVEGGHQGHLVWSIFHFRKD